MRALVCEAYGPVENLKVADLAVPEPKAGEILVRVGAAGVSFAALLGMQGKHQNKPALPYVPGNELAGHVVKLGPGVSGLAVGQRITTGVSQGAYAEYAVATAANAVTIPETMPYAQATNFPTLYPTAYGALKWKADMQPGEVLLVHGAGGGSGLTAIEVGKAMGAVVSASSAGTSIRACHGWSSVARTTMVLPPSGVGAMAPRTFISASTTQPTKPGLSATLVNSPRARSRL